MERFDGPEEALESVHAFLYDNYWPVPLRIGDEFRVLADDPNDHDEEIPFTIRIVRQDVVEIETSAKIPDQNQAKGRLYINQMYRATIRQNEHPMPFRALLAMALAFRLDQFHGFRPRQAQLLKTRSPRLQAIYRMLEFLPWLESLGADNVRYGIPGDSSPWPEDQFNCQLGVLITPMNDSWLEIGYPAGRVRHYFGGSHLDYTRSALHILAEAIRLENEEAAPHHSTPFT